MPHRLAISSGHRKSVAVLLDGTRVSKYAIGHESLNIHAFDDDQVGDRVRLLLSELARDLFDGNGTRLLDNAQRVIVSLPGVAGHAERRLVTRIVRKLGWTRINQEDLCIADDTWTGLIAGLHDDIGICAFAGTGASVLVQVEPTSRKTRPNKVDGWGPIIGDFGSRFALGHSMVQATARAIDRERERGDLSDVLRLWKTLVHISNEFYDPGRITPWFDKLLMTEPHTWRVRVAELAKFVIQEAEAPSPNPWAAELVQGVASDFAETLLHAIRRFRPATDNLRVTCQGGMFRSSQLYFDTVRDKLQQDAAIERSDYRPIVGALLLLASDSWHMPAASTAKSILQSVNSLPTQILPYFLNKDL
jgi:N-acetylglucosamine kinase-like BadF-type ATPase